MNRKKNVTGAVISANQENAKKSTGPTTEQGKAASRSNALKHGLTAKEVGPDRDLTDPEFERELEELKAYYNPIGPYEEKLVREALATDRQLDRVNELMEGELSRFGDEVEGAVLGSVDGVFANRLTPPIDAMDLPIQRGLQCERLIVRATTIKDKTSIDSSRGPGGNAQGQAFVGAEKRIGTNGRDGQQLEIHAEMSPTLDKLLRYQAALKRDRCCLHKEIRAAQAERRKKEEEGGGGPIW